MADPVEVTSSLVFRAGASSSETRIVPNEVAVALTYGGSTQAVMMATPADLVDFGVGFSLTEGLIDGLADVKSLEIVEEDEGIEVRIRLTAARAETFSRRKRLLAGPTGCGLCGIESLAEAVRPPVCVPAGRGVSPADIATAMAALPFGQVMNAQAKAMHAAAFWTPSGGIVAVREDVGRHNALDKLVGAMAATGISAADGIVLLTSRVSVEMIQKAAMMGAPIVAAVSAPTALAIRMAEQAGITLIAIARGDAFQVFSHPERLQSDDPQIAARSLTGADDLLHA